MEIINNFISRMNEKMVAWHSRHVSARTCTHARTHTRTHARAYTNICFWLQGCSQTVYDRYRLASDRWGRSSVSLLLYGCTERHAFGCMSNLCGKAWHFSFLQRWHLHVFKWVTYVFLKNALLDQFLVYCVARCGLMVWNLFWFGT
jgi:hypothetical protein